ncbi:MAG: ribosome silencing factor [Pseudomonadota bacterium]
MQTGSQPNAAIPNGASGANSADLLSTVLATLEDAKAEDIQTIDIAGKSSIGDHMIIASGRSHRHVGAVADKVLRDIKSLGNGTARVEGLPTCDWVLIDAGDIIIHVFRPEVREFYALEKMWAAPDMRPEASDETAN